MHRPFLNCQSNKLHLDRNFVDTFFTPEDSLLLGPETRGLPPHVLEQCGLRVHIPIRETARSLNMSTAAGIVLYAALACLGTMPASDG